MRRRLYLSDAASITPGPTNILVLSNSARFGWRAVVPLILGTCTGAALLVLLVGMGLGHSFGSVDRFYGQCVKVGGGGLG
ncbi:hypothetical protein ALP55_04388 [Pseudomonas coronafaciens pv. oryzae]|nr:hypothetical protein ALP55_04388 [Pseudomonas coronafaciens pv. oryzae]